MSVRLMSSAASGVTSHSVMATLDTAVSRFREIIGCSSYFETHSSRMTWYISLTCYVSGDDRELPQPPHRFADHRSWLAGNRAESRRGFCHPHVPAPAAHRHLLLRGHRGRRSESRRSHRYRLWTVLVRG